MVSLFIAWLGMFLRVRAYVLSLFVRLTSGCICVAVASLLVGVVLYMTK